MYYAIMPKHDDEDVTSGMRLDKWLWCARFFKTRSQAADAIKSGRILVNEKKPKPSRLIDAGARIRISKAPYRFDITVTALSGNRKSAADATLLFTETPESTAEREKTAAQLKIDFMISPKTKGRPTKHERRALLGFKNRL
jgi:ribosome-associated heat shock protein Hsp15